MAMTVLPQLPGAVESGEIVEPTEVPASWRMSDSTMTHLFAVSRRIWRQVTDKTSLGELYDMCAASAMLPKFRDALYAGLCIEYAYKHDLPELGTLANFQYERLVATYEAD